MALLTLDQRKQMFKVLGYGEYNEASIKKMQGDYLRSKDVDGIYGTNTDNLVRHLYNVKKFTKNFTPQEFKCGCGGRYCTGYPTYMKASQLSTIQDIRTHYGKPMTITCGLRCYGYNKSLSGSVSNSRHLDGLACDYYVAGVTDTLANRRNSINWIKTLKYHRFTYGNGCNSYGQSPSAPCMGNALHTDSEDVAISDVTPTPQGYNGEFPNLNSGVISANSQAISAATSYGRQMVAQKIYYKKWTSDTKTHQCYVCHPNSGRGANCIGAVGIMFKHGAGANVNCAMNGLLYDGWADKLYKKSTDAAKVAFWRSRNGDCWDLVKSPSEGCVGLCYQKGDYKHTIYCSSSTTIIDSTSGQKGVKERNLSAMKSYTKIYFKYTGNGKFTDITRGYLMKGDKGDEVVKLQKLLNWYGNYGLATDGIFGDGTRNAVKDFQSKNGLTADGAFGSASLAKAKEITK